MVKKSVVYFIAILLLLGILAWFFSDIFIYFILSLVLATILRPLTNYLSKLQVYGVTMPRVIAVIISFIALLSVLSFFILLFIPLVNEQMQILIRINYEELVTGISAPLANFEEFLIKYGLAKDEPGTLLKSIQDYIASLIEPLNITLFINRIISLAGSFFIGLLAVVFITFFLLYEKGLLRKQIINLIPNRYFEVSIAAIYKTEKLLTNYLLGLMFQMLTIFSIIYIGITVVGLKYALAIAVFSAVAKLIPYLGPILGTTFAVFVGLSTGTGFVQPNDYIFLILEILLVFAIMEVTDLLIFQPLIFSKSVKAHPLEIFIIIFVGATLAGVPGMIAAIPAYTVLRVSIIELYNGYTQYRVFKS